MVSAVRFVERIMLAQAFIERHVEAALVAAGYRPNAIELHYEHIRELMHSPRGRMLSPDTYRSYMDQIVERGPRESEPYQRVMSAIDNRDLYLDRWRR